MSLFTFQSFFVKKTSYTISSAQIGTTIEVAVGGGGAGGSGGGNAFITAHGNTNNQRGQIEIGSDNLVGDGTTMGRIFFYNFFPVGSN